MEEAGIIRPSKSPYVSQTVVVIKKEYAWTIGSLTCVARGMLSIAKDTTTVQS